jgi:hypothetical protein
VVTSGREHRLSMSALSGLVAIRRYAIQQPEIPLSEIVSTLKRISPDDAYHDYEAAIVLSALVTDRPAHWDDTAGLFRDAIRGFIEETQPFWMRLSSWGRERVRAALSANEEQCFEAAGLFAEVPSVAIRQWWDELSRKARLSDDDRKLQQGRRAEQLTIVHESQRLAALGITNAVKWVALDDNAAGYDVQSYDEGIVEPIAKLIEVKSTARDSREIFLTRNEWKTAIERVPHYFFHVWLFPEEELIEITPDELRMHIPSDQGTGEWQMTKVSLLHRRHF